MKMIMKKTMFTAAVLAAVVTVTQAQQRLTLDLDTALEIALTENPTIQVADMEIQRYDYVRRETRGSHLPQLTAGGQYTYSAVKQEMSKGLSFGANNTITGTADLNVPLFMPAVYATLKMNRTEQELAVELARASRIDLVNAVKKSFYQILLLEKSYDVLKASEGTIQETVDDTRAMYESGLASEYDLLTAEVQLSNLQPDIISTRNGIVVSKQMMKMYLSIPEEIDIEVTGSLDDYRDELYGLPDLSADVEENTEIRQLDYQQKLLRHQIKLTNTARMPSISGFGSFIYTGNDMKSIDFGSAMGDLGSLYTNPATMINNAAGFWGQAQVPDNVLWQGLTPPSAGSGSTDTDNSRWWWQHPLSIGINISIPIFSGLQNTNRVKSLRNQVTQVELQKQYLREAKKLEASTSVNNLVSARETMLANEKTVAQADKAHNIARTRFEAGAGTMLEVNQAELNVTQARLNHSQSIYDYLAAKADYDKVVGKDY